MITSPITTEGTVNGIVPPAGPQGLSAYEVWLAAGNQGSASQFLASLQGPAADPTSLNAAVSRATVAATNAGGYAAAAAQAAAAAATTLTNIASQISAGVQSAVSTLMTALQAAVTAASGSATTASAAATNASNSATAAAGSATTAQGAATSATTQASAASTSASTSAGSATAASTSAGAATASAATAKNWAMQASGTVDGTSYSAKYYALQAAASAQQASAGGIAATGTFAVGDLLVAGNTAATVAKSGGRPGFIVVDSPASPYTSVNRDEVWWSTAAGPVTQLLPASPTAGMRVRAMRSGANTVTVAQNGNTIAGTAADLVIDRDGHGVELIWDATLSTWLVLLLQHA